MEKIIHIDYMRCLKALIRKLPLAIVIGILAGILGAVACYFVLDGNNAYTARSSVYTHSTNTYGNAAEGVQYAELVKSLTVAERALDIMGNSELSAYDIYDMVTLDYDDESVYVNSSAVINIFATSQDSQLAVEVANAVAEGFVDEVNYIMQETGRLAVLDVALIATTTYNAQQQFWIVTSITAALAFFITCFVVALLEVLSFRLITISDGTLYGKLNIIGVIPNNDEV